MLRLDKLRQRDDVSAHPAHPAAVDCRQQPAVALGENIARKTRAGLMQKQETTTFRNTIILIVGLFLFWELAYLVAGHDALRLPSRPIQFPGRLMQADHV